MTSTGGLTLLSAFSGLGGLDLGLEAAGFDVLGCIEWDPSARRSLKRASEGRWPVLEPGDIRTQAAELAPRDLGLRRRQLDLLAGAPPCQPFSKAGQWASGKVDGLGDERASYIDDFLTLVETFLPRAVLIENVIGFVQGKNAARAHLRTRLQDINGRNNTDYSLEVFDVDAANYGVPQHRRRAIIVMLRDGREFVAPDRTHIDAPITAWDAIGSLPRPDPCPKMTGKWAELLPSIPEGENYLFHTPRGQGIPLFGWRTRYWSFLLKLARGRPSWTLPASPGPATGPFHWDNRPLGVSELLRIQSFPLGYAVEADSRRDAVRQVGNATPPLLAEAFGRQLASTLRDDAKSGKTVDLRFEIPRLGLPPDPSPPQSVPDLYIRAAPLEVADHPGPGLGPRAAGQGAAV